MYSENVRLITIRNLLEHTSGGWDNYANDAAWTQPHLDADHLIDYVLENYPIENRPGTQWYLMNMCFDHSFRLLLGYIRILDIYYSGRLSNVYRASPMSSL